MCGVCVWCVCGVCVCGVCVCLLCVCVCVCGQDPARRYAIGSSQQSNSGCVLRRSHKNAEGSSRRCEVSGVRLEDVRMGGWEE